MAVVTGWARVAEVARFVRGAWRAPVGVRRAVLALVLSHGAALIASAPTSAQESSARPAPRSQRTPAKTPPKARGKRRGQAAPAPKQTPAAETAVEAEAAPAPEGQADTADAPATQPPGEVHTEGDTQVKVMEFSGLDIEGQLKTPQMLYFLNRLRAEFGRPRLPHRSFMPELQRGTQEQAQR
jgi:hypothetical protein